MAIPPPAAAIRTRFGGLALALALGSCFDSDQRPGADATTTSGAETGPGTSGDATTGTDTATGTTETTGPAPERTCRGAIDCIFSCLLTGTDPNPGPDEALACILQCQEGMNPEEVLDLLRLSDCVGSRCADEGRCTEDTGTGTDTGTTGAMSLHQTTGDATEGTATGTDDTTSTTSSGGGSTTAPGDDGGSLDPCTDCLLAGILDPQSPGCEAEADACT